MDKYISVLSALQNSYALQLLRKQEELDPRYTLDQVDSDCAVDDRTTPVKNTGVVFSFLVV